MVGMLCGGWDLAGGLAPPSLPRVSIPGLPLFCVYRLQHPDVEHLIGHDLLRLRVFLFQLLEPLGGLHLHLAILAAPPMESRFTDVVLTANCFYLAAFVQLAKDFNDLFYGMSLFLHYSDRLLAHQNLIFNGPVCGGQVSGTAK